MNSSHGSGVGLFLKTAMTGSSHALLLLSGSEIVTSLILAGSEMRLSIGSLDSSRLNSEAVLSPLLEIPGLQGGPTFFLSSLFVPDTITLFVLISLISPSSQLISTFPCFFVSSIPVMASY